MQQVKVISGGGGARDQITFSLSEQTRDRLRGHWALLLKKKKVELPE